MRFIDKKNGFHAGREIKIFLTFLGLLFMALSGCKGDEVEPPVLKPEPLVVQASPVDEKLMEIKDGEDVTEVEKAGDYEGETDDDIAENSPPELVSLQLHPSVIYPGTMVKVLAEGKDKEEEDITFYYRWQKNEEFLPDEKGEELDTSGFKKGDFITAFVTPFDGEVMGKERMSPSLLISNRPPEIISAPIDNIVDGLFIYEVKAIDPDGDELKFSLESGPAGMTIDSSGKVEWRMPPDAKGPFVIKVAVTDGDAISFQGFSYK